MTYPIQSLPITSILEQAVRLNSPRAFASILPSSAFQKDQNGFLIPLNTKQLEEYFKKVADIDKMRSALLEQEEKDRKEAFDRKICLPPRRVQIEKLSAEEVRNAYQRIEAQKKNQLSTYRS